MKEFSFSVDGTQLFAYEEGEGVPIVMLHGGIADHRAAWPLVAPLVSSHRVIAPDLRGSGRSWRRVMYSQHL